MLIITYTQTMTLDTHTQSTFNKDAVHNLYNIMVTATRVVGLMKMGNIVPRVGIELTYLAFQASLLTNSPPRIPDITHAFLFMRLHA